MEQTLTIINRMKEDGVIEDYAIGGAIAAIFYIEPFATEDLDIFIVIQAEGLALDILSPIYRYLERYGYQAQNEMIHIEGWPVQFLPVFNPLNEEAVEQANEIEYNQTPVRVMRAEHLVAIMLDTGRPKDYARMTRFLEADIVDMESLMDILSRHGLDEKWRENKARFLP
jgi:hypothetical protein